MFFPHPLTAEEDGLLAWGGDLSAERLLLAYQYGIFPWYNDPPILWWWTFPRCVMRPIDFKLSKSLKRIIDRNEFSITYNHDFDAVIRNCRSVERPGQGGTWITENIMSAYTELHEMGICHSVEVWQNSKLVGGLYGIALGKLFIGESMFANVSNASKVGFYHLCKYLSTQGFHLIDCQQETPHLKSLGAWMMAKNEFWNVIKVNQKVIDNRLTF